MSKFCPNCGNELSEGADVCTKCGKMVSSGSNPATGSKNKIAAALLAFFLGAFGVHNFYLGYTGRGVAQLLLTLIGWLLLFLGPAIAGIWAFVEFILILTGGISTDAQGNPLV